MEQQKLSIEDGSGDKKYFTLIPNYVLNHSTAIDQALYCQMKRLTEEGGKDICYPSVSYLMKQLKAGKQSIRKSIKYLVGHKWIEDRGKRKVRTKGGYQWVQCYRVNDIWKLNMDYYQKEQGGFSQTPPEENKGGLENAEGGLESSKGGLVMSLKEEPLKKEHIKEELTISNASVAGKEINLLIEKFKPVNPSYEQLFKNKSQRQALERLLKKTTPDNLGRLINLLPKTNQMKYSPTVTTPCQLESKLGQLLAFIQKEKKSEEENKILII
jgi:hypothetical protein